MSANNRRRRYWIDARFQGRYLGTILLLEVGVATVSSLFTLAFAFVLMSAEFEAGSSWGQTFVMFVSMLIAVGFALAWLGVRTSHRIFGPVYRIRKSLEAVRAGEIPGPIHLRNKDEFQELASDLNATFDVFAAQAKR